MQSFSYDAIGDDGCSRWVARRLSGNENGKGTHDLSMLTYGIRFQGGSYYEYCLREVDPQTGKRQQAGWLAYRRAWRSRDPLLWYCGCSLAGGTTYDAFERRNAPNVYWLTKNGCCLGEINVSEIPQDEAEPAVTWLSRVRRFLATTFQFREQLDIVCQGKPFGTVQVLGAPSSTTALFEIDRATSPPLTISAARLASSQLDRSRFQPFPDYDYVLPTRDKSLSSEEQEVYFLTSLLFRVHLFTFDFSIG